MKLRWLSGLMALALVLGCCFPALAADVAAEPAPTPPAESEPLLPEEESSEPVPPEPADPEPSDPADPEPPQEDPAHPAPPEDPLLPPDDGTDLPTVPESPALPDLPETLAATLSVEEPFVLPTFTAVLQEDETGARVYGTLSHLPAGVVSVAPMYYDEQLGEPSSVIDCDGTGDPRLWDLSAPEDPATLTQLCIAAADPPLWEYLDGASSRFLVFLALTMENDQVIHTQPALITRNAPSPMPETPPDFRLTVKPYMDGWRLYGTFTDFTPDVLRVEPLASLDGADYAPFGGQSTDWLLYNLPALGTGDESDLAALQTQVCARSGNAPFSQFLSGEVDGFFVKLRITTETGLTYDTQPARLSRQEAQPQPEGTTVQASYVTGMQKMEGNKPPYYGEYHVTVREGMSASQVQALLPETLPVYITLSWSKSQFTYGTVDRPVTWDLSGLGALSAGDVPAVLHNAAQMPSVPAGTTVETPTGVYTLSEQAEYDPRYVTGEVRLVLHVIGQDALPDVRLADNLGPPANSGDARPLSLAFVNKPSGATSVQFYCFPEGSADWSAGTELLTQRAVDANPSAPGYGYLTLLSARDDPYRQVLDGTLPGFTVGLRITGGVYDGQSIIAPWPAQYTVPPGLGDPGGSGGNEGNAGSGGNTDGDSDQDGQRPNLPGQGDSGSGEPPSLLPPAPPVEPPPEGLIPAQEPETVPSDKAQLPVQETAQPTAQEKTVHKPQADPGAQAQPLEAAPQAEPSQTPPTPAPKSQTAPQTTTPPAEPIPPQPPAEPEKKPSALPTAAVVALALTGGGAVAVAGLATSGAAASGGGSGLVRILRRLLWRK